MGIYKQGKIKLGTWRLPPVVTDGKAAQCISYSLSSPGHRVPLMPPYNLGPGFPNMRAYYVCLLLPLPLPLPLPRLSIFI